MSLIGVAGLVAVGCWFLLNKNKVGTILKAVILTVRWNPDGYQCVACSHHDLYWRCILGGLGGLYIAPTISAAPGLGTEVIVLSFAVVVVGGMGSIAGAAIGSVIIGVLRAVAVSEPPQAELFVVFAVMAIVLVPTRGFVCASCRGRFNMLRDTTSQSRSVWWAVVDPARGFCAKLDLKSVHVRFFARACCAGSLGSVVLDLCPWSCVSFGLGAMWLPLLISNMVLVDVFYACWSAMIAGIAGFAFSFILRNHRDIFLLC